MSDCRPALRASQGILALATGAPITLPLKSLGGALPPHFPTPLSPVLWCCRRQRQLHSASPLAGRLSSGFMASLRLPVLWKFSLPFPATSQSARERLGFHSWELCSEWKFLVKIIPGYEWSVQEDRSLSKKLWEQPRLSRCSEQERAQLLVLEAPSQWGQAGGPPSPSSLEGLCILFPWMPRQTLKGSGPPPPAPPAPAKMSDTEGEMEGSPSPEPTKTNFLCIYFMKRASKQVFLLK